MTTPNRHRVRTAEAYDEQDILALCAMLNYENAMFPPDFDKIRMRIRSAISGPVHERQGVIGVIGGNGRPMEGMAYITLFQDWYTASWSAKELFNFVHPDFRSGTSNSHDLIAWSKGCADAFTVPLFMGILSVHRTEAKVRHYRAQFGAPIGAYFAYGLEGAA